MPNPTDAAVANTPKFGDWMRGIYASEKNPLRDGMFVRTIRRTGRCNPGTYYELTDGRGKFWQYPRESTVMLDADTRAQAPAGGEWLPMRLCPADIDVLCLTKDGRQQVAMQDGPSSIFLDWNCHNVRPIAWRHLPEAAMTGGLAGEPKR